MRRALVRTTPLVALVLVLTALFSAGRAMAAPRRTAIALVQGGAGPELGARLRAELEAVGWRVLDVDPEGEVALPKIARRAATLAVVRVGQSAEGIEVWVAPEVDAQARSEWIDVDNARPDLAVVLAVESLRARFVELGIEPEGTGTHAPVVLAPPPKPAPPKPVRATESPSKRLPLWVGAAGGGSMSPGGVNANAFLRAHLRLAPLPAWEFGIELWWPPSPSTLEAVEGTSEVRAVLAAVSAEYRYERPRGSGGIGAGAALAALDLRGTPSTGYVGRSDRILTSVPFVRVSAELALLRRLRLRLDGSLGMAIPRAVIRFDDRNAATWGRPLGAVALGVDWAVLDP